MLLVVFVTVFLSGIDGHIKFTECQAEYYRTLPGNEDVVFETDGPPCQNKRKRRGLTTWNKKWNNVLQNGKYIVPYFFEDRYENHQYGNINAAEAMERMEEMLDHFKVHTCVEFKRLKTEEEKNQYDYKIMIVHDENNEGTCRGWSHFGRLSLEYQPQRLNMCPGMWAFNHNTAMQHEAMHALGFHHEQNRADRDEHVEIHPILAGDSQYAKLIPAEWRNTGSPYDFHSVMHYPSRPVGSDEFTISVPGSRYKTPITTNQVYPFSEEDIKQINHAYCSASARSDFSTKSAKFFSAILFCSILLFFFIIILLFSA